MRITSWIRDPATRRGWACGLIGAAALAAGLVACGGGDMAPASTAPGDTTAGSAAYTEGTLTGFGSIIVNGIRFDESAATVTDDAGTIEGADALRLGMRLEVESSAVADNGARANAVRFGSIVLGPVAAVDATAQTVTVLGQTVDVLSDTVFDDTLSGGLSSLAVGAVIAVHGMPDAASGHLVATRIESATGATRYKLRGIVASLDTTSKTFAIGGAVIDHSAIAAASVPASLGNGAAMRVLLATTPNALGQWVATALGQGAPPKPPEKAMALVRGTITKFTSSASFSVNGLAVDASGASFPDGSSGLALGVAVEVVGTVNNGVLIASAVRLEAEHAGDDSHVFTLHGAITALDPSAKTFVVRHVTVSYAQTVSYVNGTEADLAVGRSVAVTGSIGGADGTGGGGLPVPKPKPHQGMDADHSVVQAQTITFQ